METFLVGGAVRDELLGLPLKDKDYLVLGCTEEEFLRLYPRAKKVGQAEPVFILKGEEYTLSPKENLEEDLYSRDLTVNALARDSAGRLYCHEKSLEDLEQKILRPVRPENFFKDPLRIFRAARLAARLPNFRLHPELRRLMQELSSSGILAKPAPERVGQEVIKALDSPKPGRFIKILSETACLMPWFKELAKASEVPAGPFPHHCGSLLGHLIKMQNQLPGRPLPGWMALVHDLGKTLTNPEHWPHHYGHEKKGKALAQSLGQRLKLPQKFIQAGISASALHMKAGLYPNLKPGKKVDLLVQLNSLGLLEEMFALVQADQGRDFLTQAREDLFLIQKVKLPADKRNLGPKSGEILKQLRSQALKKGHRKANIILLLG